MSKIVKTVTTKYNKIQVQIQNAVNLVVGEIYYVILMGQCFSSVLYTYRIRIYNTVLTVNFYILHCILDFYILHSKYIVTKSMFS